ncbi:MAG: hypothetical protein JST37_09590 [Bacteroidetes bacterium]|nr:hypothetical protein [Bacteroidota bacterium]
MNTKDILLIVLPIISGVGGSYLTYYLTQKSKRNEAILKFKEEKYGNLLILLQGFVGVTAKPETKRAFFEEQYKSWLYSSDEVVKAINSMVNSLRSVPAGQYVPDGKNAIGKIVLAMRKDMLGKTKLSPKDFEYIDVRDR